MSSTEIAGMIDGSDWDSIRWVSLAAYKKLEQDTNTLRMKIEIFRNWLFSYEETTRLLAVTMHLKFYKIFEVGRSPNNSVPDAGSHSR